MSIQPLQIPTRVFGQLLPVAPDTNAEVAKINELVTAVNARLATSNAIVGGLKYVEYLSSQTYGVPAEASTLNRLDPTTILPGNLAMVINPHPTPITQMAPSKQYVATISSAEAAGAVLVPAYTGAPTTVPIVWQEVVDNSSFTPLLPAEVNDNKSAYAGLALRPLLIALVNGIGTGTNTVTTQAPATASPAAPRAGLVDDTADTFSGLLVPGFPSLADYEVFGVPGQVGIVSAAAASCNIQNSRLIMRGLTGPLPIGIVVVASGNRQAGASLTNAQAFTGTTVVTPPAATLAVTFTIGSATTTVDQSLSYSTTASGGTAPYAQLVQATNADIGAITSIGAATTPAYAGIWQSLPAGTYDLTATVTDAAGTTKTSPGRRVVVSAVTTTPAPLRGC